MKKLPGTARQQLDKLKSNSSKTCFRGLFREGMSKEAIAVMIALYKEKSDAA